MEIIYNDDSERAFYEAELKGYLLDIQIVIDNKSYFLSVYSMTRLYQDFEEEYNNYGYYIPDKNLVIVNSVTKVEIENIIKKLLEEGYFNQ